jgi:UDPglucose 6-dehydrogenase
LRNASISIVGLGYVGLTTAACFASRRIKVMGIDVDEDRVRKIHKGVPVILEPGLQPLLDRAIRSGNLELRTGFQEVTETDVSFITTGTPGRADGSIDTSYVEDAAREIGRSIRGKEGFHLVVVKSTVVPGTTSGRVRPILETETRRKIGEKIGLAVNPEFLYEGTAVHDTMKPEALVVGTNDETSRGLLTSLYRRFYRGLPPTIFTTPENAELVKYAINSARSVQVSYVNFLANLSSRIEGGEMGAIIAGLARVAKLDRRYLGPGLGAGGSCVPPYTRVITESGFRPISEIKVGDRVLSHDGRYHGVSRTFTRDYDGTVHLFKSQGFTSTPLLVTPEHPILSCKRNSGGGHSRSYQTTIPGRGLIQKLSNLSLIDLPAFADPLTLAQGDFMVLPKFSEASAVPPGLRMDLKMSHHNPQPSPDIMYLFGLWLAEGVVNSKKGEVVFSFGAKERELLREIDTIVHRYFGVKASEKKSITKENSLYVSVKSKALALYLERAFGKRAEDRHIPWDWLRLPDDLLVPLLRGMWYGNGSNRNGEPQKRFTYASISRSLVDFIEVAFLRLRVPYRRLNSNEGTDKHGVHHWNAFYLLGADNSTMNKLLPKLHIELADESHKTSWFESDKYVFPIEEVQTVKYTGTVFNLEVDESNSYVVDGATLHNCLPKDSRALRSFAESLGIDTSILDSAIKFNEAQPLEAIKMAKKLVGDLTGKKAAVLGLAFKAGTDDVRESTAIRVVEALLAEEAHVIAYDPEATENASYLLRNRVVFARSAEECIKGADVCIIATGWKEFKGLKPQTFKKLMRNPAVVDGRRMLDPKPFARQGVPFLRVGTAAKGTVGAARWQFHFAKKAEP